MSQTGDFLSQFASKNLVVCTCLFDAYVQST